MATVTIPGVSGDYHNSESVSSRTRFGETLGRWPGQVVFQRTPGRILTDRSKRKPPKWVPVGILLQE